MVVPLDVVEVLLLLLLSFMAPESQDPVSIASRKIA